MPLPEAEGAGSDLEACKGRQGCNGVGAAGVPSAASAVGYCVGAVPTNEALPQANGLNMIETIKLTTAEAVVLRCAALQRPAGDDESSPSQPGSNPHADAM